MRKYNALLVLFLSLFAVSCLAGEKPDYAIGAVPMGLQTNANAILRRDERVFELLGPGRARETHLYAITILNERGDKHAQFHEQYDKLHDISGIEGTLYDAMGQKI